VPDHLTVRIGARQEHENHDQDDYVVERTCRHAAKQRPPSARAVGDAQLRPQILLVWEQNLSV